MTPLAEPHVHPPLHAWGDELAGLGPGWALLCGLEEDELAGLVSSECPTYVSGPAATARRAQTTSMASCERIQAGSGRVPRLCCIDT
eukprot:scaffold30644_cov67-Phaeocystis_antarctica.AAC.5